MSARLVTALVWAVCAALALATFVFLALGAGTTTPADEFGLAGLGGLAFVVASLAFATTGAMVASRLPRNPVGWVFCLIGFLIASGDLPYQYADYALFVSPGALPGGDVAAVLQNLGLTPCFGLLAIALLLFPDGRPPSRRWRPALAIAATGSILVGLGYALRPGPLDDPFGSVENPLGVGGFDFMDGLSGLGWLLMTASLALAGAAMVVRLRRSRGAERQQLKWIALAAAGVGLVMVANFASFALGVEGHDVVRIVVLGLAFAALPVAAGIAILRYRLYDIDVVINRALVYGALTVTLAGAYLGSVLLLQLVLSGLTSGSSLAVAASTLAVAALLRPARARIQRLVDRRFYRRRYDVARTLEGFGARVRDEVDLDALSAELRWVVAETMQPAQVSLWIRPR